MPDKNPLKKLIPHLITSIALLASCISATILGKDNIIEIVANVVIDEIMQAECHLE